MPSLVSCQICGNEIDSECKYCPYCSCKQEDDAQQAGAEKHFYQKTVNLEQNLPTVAQALSRLQGELASGKEEKIRILTLIHGYGSTGKGGAIRLEVRRTLDYLCSRGEIHTVIHGEDFTRRQGQTKHLLGRFPDLAYHPHLNQQNKGVTIVQLF